MATGNKVKYNYKMDNYLDIDELMQKYAPLRKSIFRLFSRYNNLWTSADEYEDLHQQIDYEFIRLCREYDPTVGVDFPGYIKSHLQQRVYHYITKIQNNKRREGVVFAVDNDGEPGESIDIENMSSKIVDEKSDNEFRKMEMMASLNVDDVPDKYKSLVNGLLFEHKSLEDIASEEGVSVRTLQLRLNAACDYFVKDYYDKEQYFMYTREHPFIYNRVPFIKRTSLITRTPIIIVRVPFVVRVPIIERKPVIIRIPITSMEE